MILPRLHDAIAFGGDYNPEQWPESVWQEDVRLMREAGVNLVTVGVFSWAKLQPSEKRFDFGWLDRVLDLLAANQIGVCLATATASPPPWLSARYPEVLPITADGVRLQVGARQHYSPSSRVYRKFASALVTKMARRYTRHPALVTWHINNEYACHVPECHGPDSTRAFRTWLKKKYRSLPALNDAWGTAFWSQGYGQWDEIFTPSRAPYHCNPTQCLDFKRFTNDAFLELYDLELAILRRATPDVPVTTNFMGFFKALDYRSWSSRLDYVSWDSYPDPSDESAARRAAAAGHDLMRSLKPDRPFVLMEQASSAVNWRPVNMPKRPGVMRLQSLQAIARGGDGVMFFQWRASKAGAEKYHSGMLQHVSAKDSRVFAEVKMLGAELKKLGVVTGSRVRNRVAIAFDWHAWWAVELESKPGRIDYAAWAQQLHGWFYAQNLGVDFVHPGSDVGRYDLVVAPALYLLSEKDGGNLQSFVERGGTLLATYFSGVVDEKEHAVCGGYPAYLRQALGLWVEEWVPYPDGRSNRFRFGPTRADYRCDHWCDLVHLDGAQSLAVFTGDYFAGRPAATRHRYGKGAAYYLATRPEPTGLDVLLSQVVKEARLAPPVRVPAGVEVAVRHAADAQFLFLLNHSEHPAKVALGRKRGRDLLTGDSLCGTVRLPPCDVRVMQLPGE